MDAQVVWSREEPCDCGEHIRHNDGGNYHRWAEIRRLPDGRYLGVSGDTRAVFPGDERQVCPVCGFVAWKDSTTHVCPTPEWDDPRLVELRESI